MGVLDAMPASNLKPESEEVELERDRVYRTTYMFSATMPPAVERLARKYLRRPIVINIGSAGRATDNVTQKVYMVKDNDKPSYLERVRPGSKPICILSVFGVLFFPFTLVLCSFAAGRFWWFCIA